MNRRPYSLVAFKVTVVPPDHFALAAGDLVTIDITGIGRLTNPVEQLS
jgi:2-keto-4-pentenoate hydratase/2-oxohepta-3-ene-1,7-dioic acid hydratase in catechol pathway